MAINKFSISTIDELKKVADFISNLINTHSIFLFKGKDDFLIPAEAINDPDSYLSSMVVSSYREVEKEN